MHLALVVLVQASILAVSAYYMHHKTLTKLLKFARMVKREADSGNNDSNAESPMAHFKK